MRLVPGRSPLKQGADIDDGSSPGTLEGWEALGAHVKDFHRIDFHHWLKTFRVQLDWQRQEVASCSVDENVQVSIAF